ncbi:hypothetical protein B9T39_05980 [Alloscardovia macacae]|uniref:Phosphatidic acid phosphatase type 2/haloperoxidase domain-containing protein n=1 Tax=Alloscardovia macacae TaxID=1160091 RepID=A0A1Y2SXC8_9BIFI|nr:phosphatase PAP2 family protein [Alloscardovia macacae]OTA28747.1 hypothetical protein B9T39_05980 [Alloscardovia macacae]
MSINSASPSSSSSSARTSSSVRTSSRALAIRAARQTFAWASGVSGVIFLILLALVWPGLTRGWDAGITAAVVAHRNGVLNVVAPALSKLGGTAIVLVLAVVGLALLAWKKKWLQVKIFFAALAGDVIIVTAFKRLVSRPRPDASLWLGHVEDQQSFPSGHSANNTVLWLMLAIIISTMAKSEVERAWARAFNVVAVIIPLLIGLSRIYVAHHWTTDVLGGWALGFAWTAFCAWVYFGQLAQLQARVGAGRGAIRPKN